MATAGRWVFWPVIATVVILDLIGDRVCPSERKDVIELEVQLNESESA